MGYICRKKSSNWSRNGICQVFVKDEDIIVYLDVYMYNKQMMYKSEEIIIEIKFLSRYILFIIME